MDRAEQGAVGREIYEATQLMTMRGTPMWRTLAMIGDRWDVPYIGSPSMGPLRPHGYLSNQHLLQPPLTCPSLLPYVRSSKIFKFCRGPQQSPDVIAIK